MSTVEQLRTWAASGESEILEFKRSTGVRRDAMQTLCSMLDTRGGTIIIGIAPDGKIVGQQLGGSPLEDVSEEIRLIEPPIFPNLERVPLGDGKEVIVLTVTQGPGRPYVIRGVGYRRVGNTT